MSSEMTKSIVRFEGRSYLTKKEMCEDLGLKYDTVKSLRGQLRLKRFATAAYIIMARQKQRQKKELTRREEGLIALARSRNSYLRKHPEISPKPPLPNAVPIEFRGVLYESIAEACRSFQLERYHIRHLISEHSCSYQEAIEIAIARRDAREIKAFGTVYASMTEVARHKGVNLLALKAALRENPDSSVESVVKSLRSGGECKPRQKRELPDVPVLFGWQFMSWKAAWEYWKPLGVGINKFYDYLAEGADIDARCHHELILQAERGNLTKDLRRVDQTNWPPEQGGPVKRVKVFNRFKIKARLAPYQLVKSPPKPVAHRSIAQLSNPAASYASQMK
jgi:hypothetical protein